MKATEQYFSVVLFIKLYKVVLTFESVDETLKLRIHVKAYWAVPSSGGVYYGEQGGSNFWVCGWDPKVWPFKWKLLSSTFQCCCLLCCTMWFKTTETVTNLSWKKKPFFLFFFSLVLMIPSFKWILWRGIWMAVPFNYWYLSFITLIKSRFSVGIIYFYLQDSTFRDITLQVRKKWNNSYCLWHYYLTTLLKNN